MNYHTQLINSELLSFAIFPTRCCHGTFDRAAVTQEILWVAHRWWFTGDWASGCRLLYISCFRGCLTQLDCLHDKYFGCVGGWKADVKISEGKFILRPNPKGLEINASSILSSFLSIQQGNLLYWNAAFFIIPSALCYCIPPCHLLATIIKDYAPSGWNTIVKNVARWNTVMGNVT